MGEFLGEVLFEFVWELLLRPVVESLWKHLVVRPFRFLVLRPVQRRLAGRRFRRELEWERRRNADAAVAVR